MTTLPDTEKLLLDLNKGWLTIWFNTPENRNALSSELSEELMTVLHMIRDDRSVRGITLRGKGGIFCAGGDLKSFGSALSGEFTHEDAVKLNRGGGEMFQLVNTMPQVVIALVEGAAIAGGLGMLCCADIVAVTKDAKFSLTETQLGIAPAQIAPYVVQRTGLTTARRLMLTGARFTGSEAERYGLADFVADTAGQLDIIEEDIKANVIRCAPGANAATKELVLAAPHLDTNEMMNLAAERFADCMLSDEGREGIMSFVQKKTPSWARSEEDQ
ncbi:enoyl-CoA hydratase/isomerase family protein [Parvularcula sp. IMCC14364]|uniref:enoyl-CoA hydratase/isomerase family protein n=1 Tax=Parvularcula sp. IMCC14364 TaxID=3067902 RepID=UPI0027406760|nr:enoyl-CoA hydratase-related protein [Parvularcula sp. IMCC14364]